MGIGVNRTGSGTPMMRPADNVPQVFLCTQTVDFRKSITGLSLMVEQSLQLDPFAQALYVFTNKRRDKVKILYWEKNGFCLWYRSLEKERFKWPTDLSSQTYLMNGENLNRLLDGFDLWRNKPHERLHYQSVG